MDSRGLSQAKLAQALGVYDGHVRRWRTGKGIEIGNVRKIADYFGVDRAYLEALAGYGDKQLSGTEGTENPEIGALLDADRQAIRDEFAGIPPAFWKPIIDARRIAGQLAVDNVKAALRIALGQSNYTAEAPSNNDQPPSAGKGKDGDNQSLIPGFRSINARQRSANPRFALSGIE